VESGTGTELHLVENTERSRRGKKQEENAELSLAILVKPTAQSKSCTTAKIEFYFFPIHY
jgi:hypothetical protein